MAVAQATVSEVDGPTPQGCFVVLGSRLSKEQKKALSSVENLRECSTGLPPGLEQHIASDLRLLGQLQTAGASR